MPLAREMAQSRLALVDVAGRTLWVRKPARSFGEIVEDHLSRPGGEFPWWAMIWPASLGLATRLLADAPLRGRAIELGCGLGVAGLAGAAAGLNMVQTDLEPEALALVRRSVKLNELIVSDVRVLDWDDVSGEQPYDVVIGADILYDEALYPALLAVLVALIAPGGRALLSDPGRQDAPLFLAAAAERFDIASTELTVRTDDTDTRVWVHELTWLRAA